MPPANPPVIVAIVESVPKRHGTVVVYVHIDGLIYSSKRIRTIRGRPRRLRKPDGTSYDVRRGPENLPCDCWDRVVRRTSWEGEV
jgi:hypothetical protein